MVYYQSIKCPKKKIKFRSLLELGYAAYLDSLPEVKLWDYEVMWTNYFDGFTGKQRKYLCDFRIEYQNNLTYDGDIEYQTKKVIHVEVKPLRKQTFEDKYLYAQNVIPNWRFITEEEINKSEKVLEIVSFDKIEFCTSFSDKLKKFIYWSKDKNITLPPGYKKILRTIKYGRFHVFSIINDNPIKEKPKEIKKSNNENLELDKILVLVKQNKSAKDISKTFNCDYRTIIKFLEDRSYVVYWHGSSSRHNEIRYATKLIWPLDR